MNKTQNWDQKEWQEVGLAWLVIAIVLAFAWTPWAALVPAIMVGVCGRAAFELGEINDGIVIERTDNDDGSGVLTMAYASDDDDGTIYMTTAVDAAGNAVAVHSDSSRRDATRHHREAAAKVS